MSHTSSKWARALVFSLFNCISSSLWVTLLHLSFYIPPSAIVSVPMAQAISFTHMICNSLSLSLSSFHAIKISFGTSRIMCSNSSHFLLPRIHIFFSYSFFWQSSVTWPQNLGFVFDFFPLLTLMAKHFPSASGSGLSLCS